MKDKKSESCQGQRNQVLLITVNGGDIIRKSIVFDKNTPDVFYCPQHKPTGFEKMIVKAKPLWRLCQFEGKPIPEDYKSDCYNDVDESEKRILSVEILKDCCDKVIMRIKSMAHLVVAQ
ncbi:hypothetical protein M0804_010990 [Polistes exclamans]|nr:hypothetical protein M0804_010990 [Polistes exclamans]